MSWSLFFRTLNSTFLYGEGGILAFNLLFRFSSWPKLFVSINSTNCNDIQVNTISLIIMTLKSFIQIY